MITAKLRLVRREYTTKFQFIKKGGDQIGRRTGGGIPIELNGDSSKLEASLKSVSSEIRNTESKLKDVNKLLKIMRLSWNRSCGMLNRRR